MDTLPDEGGRFELTEDAANAWVAAVNDLRLALGTMLDIRPDGPDRLPDDHPLAPHLDVYQWLTVLQEYLVLALMGSKRTRSPTSRAFSWATTTDWTPTRAWAVVGRVVSPSS